ncbi:sulfurtransferase TusA family protein [Brevundimonas aveniformis]|uniref:sulfurtransferase TusA family protein n=1 Tax=Brevundimonas aveniformis TaxID=370977 RepID=UPI000420B3F5|nr:sulfurtransferase TusA family protein [Brevundimonas aveniformis]
MKVIDARGHKCPTPTLKLGRALRDARPGDRLELIADDPMARIDVPHFVTQTGHHLDSIDDEGSAIRFRITRSDAAPTG